MPPLNEFLAEFRANPEIVHSYSLHTLIEYLSCIDSAIHHEREESHEQFLRRVRTAIHERLDSQLV